MLRIYARRRRCDAREQAWGLLARFGQHNGIPDLAPTRATALASPLRTFTGWTLTMFCPDCRKLRSRSVETLMNLYGTGAVSLGDVVARFRCHRCGSKPDWVRLADGLKWQAQGPIREVMLVQDQGGEDVGAGQSALAD
jgi:hypothetical protein